MHGVIPPEVQDLTFLLVENQDIFIGPFLQLVKVLLNGSLALWYISYSSHTGVICRLAEATLLRFGEDGQKSMQHLAIVK